ncbi:MAG: DUF5916 domain-containing protein [Vicinamibacterales bacterium]
MFAVRTLFLAAILCVIASVAHAREVSTARSARGLGFAAQAQQPTQAPRTQPPPPSQPPPAGQPQPSQPAAPQPPQQPSQQQQQQQQQQRSSRFSGIVLGSAQRRASAARASEPPVIDGLVDDAVWKQAQALVDFTQAEPFEGTPATEATEVRVLYDDLNIYVGVICWDADVSRLVTTDARRDSALAGQDSFQLIFDTYHDRQNGFIFGTTPVGLLYDAQVRNEGEQQTAGAPTLGGANTGSGGGLNVNWDGAWSVRTHIGEKNWTAEFAIPLRTLRYGPPPQTWGVNFARAIERKRELVYWSPVSRAFNITRLSLAGELTDLSVPAPRNFKVMPYAITSANRNFTPGAATDGDANWGVDAKLGVTSSMNLDLSYNTDFAQVEVDEQQINLTRFNILFPEKRPFFLENRGMFASGKSGKVDVFFSRRIGITDDGTPVPIQAGARLSGREHGINVGMLNMQTKSVGTSPANNFTAFRVGKDFTSRSTIGGMFVARAATGSLAGPDDWNRAWSADGRWGITRTWTFQGFAARTETPGARDREHAFSGNLQYQARQRRTYYEYTQVGGDFNPEVGFLERPDGYRELSTGYFENVRNEWLAGHKLREWRPHYSYDSYWGFDGFQETATLHMDSAFEFENGSLISPAVNIQWEGLRVPFQVYPGVVIPAGSYRSPYFAGMYNTDRRKWISLQASHAIGGFLSGTQVSWSGTANVRSGSRLTSVFRWTRNDVTLPQGSFITNLGSLRVGYNFTTLVNVQALIQYNDRTQRWTTNLRFNWQRDAATGLYVVYNDTEALNGLGPVNRAFVIKYTHLFDVLK